MLHDYVGSFRAATYYKEHKELPSDSDTDHKVPSGIQARAECYSTHIGVSHGNALGITTSPLLGV